MRLCCPRLPLPDQDTRWGARRTTEVACTRVHAVARAAGWKRGSQCTGALASEREEPARSADVSDLCAYTAPDQTSVVSGGSVWEQELKQGVEAR